MYFISIENAFWNNIPHLLIAPLRAKCFDHDHIAFFS